mmetsp:Transcript_7882/g.15271  ORF Transcript_7882/g.15271 Transcript_7882/m.15271 type:complete len:128 (+) Transcript_7882:2562-2945(+)
MGRSLEHPPNNSDPHMAFERLNMVCLYFKPPFYSKVLLVIQWTFTSALITLSVLFLLLVQSESFSEEEVKSWMTSSVVSMFSSMVLVNSAMTILIYCIREKRLPGKLSMNAVYPDSGDEGVRTVLYS